MLYLRRGRLLLRQRRARAALHDFVALLNAEEVEGGGQVQAPASVTPQSSGGFGRKPSSRSMKRHSSMLRMSLGGSNANLAAEKGALLHESYKHSNPPR